MIRADAITPLSHRGSAEVPHRGQFVPDLVYADHYGCSGTAGARSRSRSPPDCEVATDRVGLSAIHFLEHKQPVWKTDLHLDWQPRLMFPEMVELRVARMTPESRLRTHELVDA